MIASPMPIHLLAQERKKERDEERAREKTMAIWQAEWDEDVLTAQWTKQLIPKIKPWVERKYGETGYYLTQFTIQN